MQYAAAKFSLLSVYPSVSTTEFPNPTPGLEKGPDNKPSLTHYNWAYVNEIKVAILSVHKHCNTDKEPLASWNDHWVSPHSKNVKRGLQINTYDLLQKRLAQLLQGKTYRRINSGKEPADK